MSHNSEYCFGKRSNKKSIKDRLGVPMGISSEAVKHYKNSEHKWNKDLKSLKKKDKIRYSIATKSVSRR